MKIVSWNCQGGFRYKFKEIKKLNADIYVIQECTNPEDSKGTEYEDYYEFAGENYFWVGDDPSEEVKSPKGLGIFVKSDNIDIKLLNEFDEEYKYFIHLNVNDSFDLMGVWAMPKYVEMIHDLFDANEKLFNENLIMCGDFNSNQRFNYKHRKKDNNGNAKDHTHLDEKLSKKGLFSIYHKLSEEDNGKESRFTFFQAKHLNKPFYLDYIYANEDIIGKTELLYIYKRSHDDIPNKFRILDHADWVRISDHLPIVFEMDETNFD